MNSRRSRQADRAYWGTLLSLAALPWVLPIRSPFWLDETFTYWTARGGFGDIVRRCTEWPHSMLYSGFIHAMDLVGGHGEVYLRLPSLLAMAITGLLVHRIAKDAFDGETARTALVLFAGMFPVAYAASDARPYALGVAAVAGSMWLLLGWERSGRLGYGLAYGCAAALVVHFHLLFAPVLLAQAVYLAWAVGRRLIRTGQALAAGACTVLLLAPLYPQYRSAFHTQSAHSFLGEPGVMDLVWAVVPLMLVLSLTVAVVPVLLSRRAPTFRRPPASAGHVALILLWALVPPVTLWGVSSLGSSQVFVDRFYLSSAPGLAVLWGLALRSIEPSVVRRVALAGSVLAALAQALISGTMFDHCRHVGNWRDALQFVERETAMDGVPVLIRSQFIESDALEWRAMPLEEAPSYSQLGYYQAKAAFVPLPVSVSPIVVKHLQRFAAEVQPEHQRFLVMSFSDPRPLEPMLDAVERATGPWRRRLLGDFDGVLVYEYGRR